MPSTRETLLGEATRCRQASAKAITHDVREGLLELAHRYEELAAEASPELQGEQRQKPESDRG